MRPAQQFLLAGVVVSGLLIGCGERRAADAAGDKPRLTIRHDSSAQGKVSDSEFATHFKGKGSFFR